MKHKWGTREFYQELSARLWKKKRQPLAQRFWSKVNKDGPVPKHRPELGPCWEWTGCRAPMGYGCFGVNSRMRIASRVAWELTHGPIPDGKCVLHKCDNPPCCNPGHLFLGTRTDNAVDKVAKGRARGAIGMKHPSAKLTDAKVVELRRIYASGGISLVQAGAIFGVSKGTAGHAIQRRTWKHI